MIDDFAKEYLLGRLRGVRDTMLWKLEGLGEYDVRRPLTSTGTNLLGLVKHLSITEAWYFGEVFGRPFPEPWWDGAADARTDDAKVAALFEHRLQLTDMWATEDESRAEIVDRYRRVWEHSDATIAALDIDAPGHVAWWPRPNVKLFNIMVHVLTETNRHAGHADILREQLDGAVGTEAGSPAMGQDAAFWENHRAAMSRQPGRLIRRNRKRARARPQQQSSACSAVSASRPSCSRKATTPRAASGSAHHQSSAALSTSPTSTTIDRYTHADVARCRLPPPCCPSRCRRAVWCPRATA